MTGFHIDTGAPQRTEHNLNIDRVAAIRDAILDGLPEDYTQAQYDGALVQMILGELRTPKTLKTVRGKLIGFLPLITPLAATSPASFDEIILEYAELATVLR